MTAPLRVSSPTVRLRIEALEVRSPASSLLDLAYLSLSAGDPAASPPPGPVVGVRWDADPAGGFERPHTWAVPVDDGKMADTQEVAPPPEHVTLGHKLDLDPSPPGAVSGPNWRLPGVPAATAAGDGGSGVGVSTPVGRVTATQVVTVQPVTTADPVFTPAAGGGSEQPVANGIGKEGPGDKVGGGRLKSVTFSGDDLITVLADPGDPAFYSPPHWLDEDADYTLEHADGDHSIPLGYVRDTTPTVAATFAPQTWDPDLIDLPDGYEWADTVLARGFGPTQSSDGGNYVSMDVPETVVSLAGGVLALPPTEMTVPFADYVDYYPAFTINWQLSFIKRTSDGERGWGDAGASGNELFVTLDQPAATPYFTVIHLSTTASAGAADAPSVVDKTWAAFKTRQLSTATPVFDKLTTPGQRAASKPLHYYKDWETEALTAKKLVETGDGRCGAWAELMVDTLSPHNILVLATKVMPIDNKNENFVIQKWVFEGDGKSLVEGYPYGNIRFEGDGKPDVKEGNVWKYKWDAAKAIEVVHKTGQAPDPSTGRGQGNTIPKAIFGDHGLVDLPVEGKLYDPSYGTGPFLGANLTARLKAWEEASVAGFTSTSLFPSVRFNDRKEDVFRKNQPGVLETKREGT